MTACQIAVGSLAVMLVGGSLSPAAQAARQPIRDHMTCGEFLLADDETKPEIVYWLATRGLAGKAATIIDVDVTDSMVPTLVERCKEAPTTRLTQQMKAEAERLRRRL